MKILIVGLGSIAKKHVQALRHIDSEVQLFALRSTREGKSFQGIENVYAVSDIPLDLDFIIISNPTSEHVKTIEKLVFLKAPFFIEKPLAASLDQIDDLVRLLDDYRITTYTACNLRFHPAIEWLRNYVQGKEVLEINAYCGSYLPDWRPGVDHRSIYSASLALGGGVHLDLIHEMDYILWIFGYPETVFGFRSRVSGLTLDAPDVAHYWLHYKKMVAGITLNYFRKDPKRKVEVVLSEETVDIDLINFEVTNDMGQCLFKQEPNMLETYYKQMRYFVNCLHTEKKPMNSFAEAIEVLKISLTETINVFN